MESASPNVFLGGIFLPDVKSLLPDLIHKNHKTGMGLGHKLAPPLTLEETEAQRGRLTCPRTHSSLEPLPPASHSNHSL